MNFWDNFWLVILTAVASQLVAYVFYRKKKKETKKDITREIESGWLQNFQDDNEKFRKEVLALYEESKKEVDQLTEKYENLLKEYNGLLSKYEALNEKYIALKNESDQTKAERDQLKKEVAKLQRILNNMKKSKKELCQE